MQRYFFHLNELQGPLSDPEGFELPDLGTAIKEAWKSILEMAIDSVKANEPFDIVSIAICDEAGVQLAEVTTEEALAEPLERLRQAALRN